MRKVCVLDVYLLRSALQGDDTLQLATAFVDTFKLNQSMVDTIHHKILEQLKLVQPVSLPNIVTSKDEPVCAAES